MHCMTDRLPTLLFNFQTQNIVLAVHTKPDLDRALVEKEGLRISVRLSGRGADGFMRRSVASLTAGSTYTKPQKARPQAKCPWIVRE
jgi:hypothetical protein